MAHQKQFNHAQGANKIPRHDPRHSDKGEQMQAVQRVAQKKDAEEEPEPAPAPLEKDEKGKHEPIITPKHLQNSPEFTGITERLAKTKTFQHITRRFAAGHGKLAYDIADIKGGYAEAKDEQKRHGIKARFIDIAKDEDSLFRKNKNGEFQATADPTFIAKVILHEAQHQHYDLVTQQDGIAKYPALNRNMARERAPGSAVEGEHETMAESSVPAFIRGMREFDTESGTTHSDDWYRAMAWKGSLSRATTVYQRLPAGMRKRLEKIMDNEEAYMAYLRKKLAHDNKPTPARKQAMDRAYAKINHALFDETRNIIAKAP